LTQKGEQWNQTAQLGLSGSAAPGRSVIARPTSACTISTKRAQMIYSTSHDAQPTQCSALARTQSTIAATEIRACSARSSGVDSMINVRAILSLADEQVCSQEDALLAIGACETFEHHRILWPDLVNDRTVDLERLADIVEKSGQRAPWRVQQ
jgi:hypothetical protein